MGTADARRSTEGWAGGVNRDRTGDLLHAMQALSQLSYTPNQGGKLYDEPSLDPMNRRWTTDQGLHGPTRRPVVLVRTSNFLPCASPVMCASPSNVLPLMRALPVPRMLALGHSICQL